MLSVSINKAVYRQQVNYSGYWHSFVSEMFHCISEWTAARFLTGRFFRGQSFPPLKVQAFSSFWNKVKKCAIPSSLKDLSKSTLENLIFSLSPPKNLPSTKKYPQVHNENLGALAALKPSTKIYSFFVGRKWLFHKQCVQKNQNMK